MEYLTFKNGKKMPIVGLGSGMRPSRNGNIALEIGYRHFDTAHMYRNEAVLGKVLNEWMAAGKVKREELFITTKLPAHGNHPDRVRRFLKQSLASLQLDYVDLYQIHNPVGFKYISDDEFIPKESNGDIAVDTTTNLEAIWAAMEEQVEQSRALSIGVSNFNERQLRRVVKVAKVYPVNNQVEMNVLFQQKELRAVCKELGITIVAYALLGSPGRVAFYARMGVEGFQPPPILSDPVLAEIGKKYEKNASQVAIRFLLQLGVATIPKSSNPVRIKQNFQVLDFKLSEAHMKALVGLDKGEAGRSFIMSNFKGFDKHPEFPFPKK